MVNKIAIVTTMRDEAPFLLEWIAHHRALGVTGFVIWSNDCSDGTDDLLEALADNGVVHHVPHQVKPGKSAQWQALNAAWAHPEIANADWLLCLDCDEYINLRPPLEDIQDLIAAVGDADAIILPWRYFGHAGQAFFTTEPVTARFGRAIPADAVFPVTVTAFKTLFRRQGPFVKFGVHRPKSAEGATPRFVDGSGTAMPEAFARADGRIVVPGRMPARDLVQLNHYAIRSAEDFMVKRRRGLPNRGAIKPVDAAYWAERNFNSEVDRTIARHQAAMVAEAARLRPLPGVAAAEDKGIAAYRAVISDVFRDPEEAKLFGRLLLMPGSVPLEDHLAHEVLARYQAALKSAG